MDGKNSKAVSTGKIMLFGEHSVVYGYSCIVSAVDKKVTVETEINQKKIDIINSECNDIRFASSAIKIIKKNFNIKDNITLTIKSQIFNYGLGSSSAVTVAIINSLVGLFDLNLSKKRIFDLCYEVVLEVQRAGSGFDVASAVYGGTIYYKNFGETIESLPISELNLVIGYSGLKAETVKQIQKVKSKRKKEKFETEEIFMGINRIVEEAKMGLVNKNWETVGKLMIKNHQLLKQLDVSNDKLNMMVLAALNAGAYGAKLSGAGGGDCMIALVSPLTRKKVEKAIEKVGGEIVNAKLNINN